MEDEYADGGCPRSAVAVFDVSALRARRHHSPSCSHGLMGANARNGRSLRPLVNPREPHVGDWRDAGACLLCCRNAAAMTYALPRCLPRPRDLCVLHKRTKSDFSEFVAGRTRPLGGRRLHEEAAWGPRAHQRAYGGSGKPQRHRCE